MGVSMDDRSNYLWVNVSSLIALDHSIMKYLYIFFPKIVPGWLHLVFHFGTEDRPDQLKKPPCM